MGFAVVVAAVVVGPRHFGRGNMCLHFQKTLVRNSARRTVSPKQELDWEGRQQIVEHDRSQTEIIYRGKPQRTF